MRDEHARRGASRDDGGTLRVDDDILRGGSGTFGGGGGGTSPRIDHAQEFLTPGPAMVSRIQETKSQV